MPLSDYEKHLLDDIERSLSSENPRLEQSMRRSRSRGVPRLSALGGVVGLLVGLGMLLLGVAVNNAIGVIIGVLGYVVVVLAVNICITSMRSLTSPRTTRSPHRRGPFRAGPANPAGPAHS